MAAAPCPQCSGDVVHDALYCHRCGASLVARPPRPHRVLVAGAVVVFVAAALAWAFLPGNPAAVAFAAETSAVLVAPEDAPPGTAVAALPQRYADALGVSTNPARLSAEAVDGFTDGFGSRPDEAWVEFVGLTSTEGAGVLVFSFHWRDLDDASAAARSFVETAGCSDVDVTLAGGPDVVALVAVGASAESLAATVREVADALVRQAPGLADACPATTAPPEAPQLALHAAAGSSLAQGEPVAMLEHTGGPAVDWSEASLRLARDGAPTVALAFSTTGRCADATLAPEGTLAEGQRLVLCAADDRWEPGARVDARLVRRADAREMWSGAVVLA